MNIKMVLITLMLLSALALSGCVGYYAAYGNYDYPYYYDYGYPSGYFYFHHDHHDFRHGHGFHHDHHEGREHR